MTRGFKVAALAAGFMALGACVNLDRPMGVVQCANGGSCQDRQDARATSDLPQTTVDTGGKPDLLVGPGIDSFGDVVGARGPEVPSGPDTPLFGPDVAAPDAADDPLPSAPVDTAPDLPPSTAREVGQDIPRDVPSGVCLVNGKPVPAGTVCRPAIDLCDVDEVCDGAGADCPADTYAPAARVCRPAAGSCDIAESCTGASPACPPDIVSRAGTVCREAAGGCDLAESCTGTAGKCPDDSKVPVGTVCRASSDGNQCDPAETCTGTGSACPDDVVYLRPEAPTGVVAEAGVLQATISWGLVSRATGYNVKRSAVSGSGYVTEGNAPTALVSPYLSLGLRGGIPAYWVVSGVNTIVTCESANSVEVTATPTGDCTPPATPLVTATAGDGRVTLNWTAPAGATSYNVARSTTAGTGYTSVATVLAGATYTDLNVTNGTTYYYVVSASNGTCGSPSSAEVSAAPTCTPPGVPTSLVATANDGSVALTWASSLGAVSYRVLRSRTQGSGYTSVGTTAAPNYTDTTVTNGITYYYVVRASNGSCNSANSLEVPATPNCTPPSRPANLRATPGNARVVLVWDPSTGGATSYQVLRSTLSGSNYIPLDTPSSTGYTDAAVTNGTTYYYVVNASNGSCSSTNSVEISATPVCTPPSVPTAFVATPGNGQVNLSWTASTGGPTSYVVSRGVVQGGPYGTNVATPVTTSANDETVTNGTTYFYVVSATNGTCSSANSVEASATPNICTQAPPTGVTATPGSQQVTLNWAAASGAVSYAIGRSPTSGSGYLSVGTVTAPATTFLDNTAGLVNGTIYYYVVTASNATCGSPNSTEVSATPVCVPPAAPSGVTATPNNTDGSITLAWNTVPGATGYTVSRSGTTGGPYTAVSTNQTAATYSDSTDLTPGAVYYYVVKASNSGGTCVSTSASAEVSAPSCSVPSVPSGVTATAGISRVTVAWTASTGDPSSYEVKRGSAAGGPFTSIGTPTASPFIDSTVTNDTAYYYVVTARNAGGACSSANSASMPATPRGCTVVSGCTQTCAPGNFNTTAAKCFVSCGRIDGWTCWNTDGRTYKLNGTTRNCGSTPIPAPKTNPYNVIEVSAGGNSQFGLNWWGALNATCTIPAGGLDF